MENKTRKSFRLLYKLTKNIVALPAVFSIFLVLFYITGNFQGFQDSTQQIILNTLSINSIFFAIISFFGLLQSIIFFFIKGVLSIREKIFYFIIMLGCLILSVSFVSISLVLNILIKGV